MTGDENALVAPKVSHQAASYTYGRESFGVQRHDGGKPFNDADGDTTQSGRDTGRDHVSLRNHDCMVMFFLSLAMQPRGSALRWDRLEHACFGLQARKRRVFDAQSPTIAGRQQKFTFASSPGNRRWARKPRRRGISPG
ncbi:hypothetical protein GWL_37840 [Herbaspirillum sp. GW103]|nr:hypothetical protein GWL_37840 [Herbaspirillum sp. GW103]